jgi:menaquinone-dependent protoporphyrinogen oxidase
VTDKSSSVNKRVLVSAGSKHGATAEIAVRLGQTLGGRGLDVTVSKPDDVESVEGYDAVVLGSGVYAGHWLSDAKELADRVAATEPHPEVWLFSSGPLGDPPKPEEDPVDVGSIVESTSATGHRIFAGKIDKSQLGFGERAIMVAVRAPEGDFRDWDAIEAWANEIADDLES